MLANPQGGTKSRLVGWHGDGGRVIFTSLYPLKWLGDANGVKRGGEGVGTNAKLDKDGRGKRTLTTFA